MSRLLEIPISEYFECVRGKAQYTRDFALQNPGDFPIYSASLSGPLAYCNAAEYAGTYLSFTTNGYAGTVQILSGEFAINGDRGLFIPKKDREIPDFAYLQQAIQTAIRPLAIGRNVDGKKNEYTKLSPETVQDATFPLLVDSQGHPDLRGMKKLGQKIRKVQQLQTDIMARCETINESNVVIELDLPFVTLELGDERYFKLSIGKRVLKADVASEGVPVYSANVRKPFGYVGWKVLESVSKASLIWGIDGNFEWNLIPEKEHFVPTDHCGRLQILDEDLSPEYLLYELNSTKEEYGFDRVFRANLNNVSQVTVRVPVDAAGHFDVERQRALTARHRNIRSLREGAVAALSSVTNVSFVPEPDFE